VLKQARNALELLEARQREADEQIDLFATDLAGQPTTGLSSTGVEPSQDGAPPRAGDATALTDNAAALITALADIHPDALSPREALAQLYHLKQLAAAAAAAPMTSSSAPTP
jgi:DNA mismatch repair protein MutS